MIPQSIPHSVTLNTTVEDRTRVCLIEHFSTSYGERVTSYVETLLRTDHYIDRFQYLLSIVGSTNFPQAATILISGCGAGSEMLAARQFGFGKIHGVEVDWFWVTLCQDRLSYFPSMYPVLYGGDYLPYADEQFEVVASGHVIEHTSNPSLYLRESMRILIPGGYLALEFPGRYHYRELHTQLPSFEWLPQLVRNAIIRVLSSDRSPLKPEAKSRYRSIITTNLQQISMMGVKRMLERSGYHHAIINSKTVAPGIIRCVIRKG